jgi:hypothetical protein
MSLFDGGVLGSAVCPEYDAKVKGKTSRPGLFNSYDDITVTVHDQERHGALLLFGVVQWRGS